MEDTEREQLIARHKAEMDRYKARVRAIALEAKEQEGWCIDGVNGALRRLNLEPIPPMETYRFEAPMTGKVRYEVDATSPEEAIELMENLWAEDQSSIRYSGGRLRNAEVFLSELARPEEGRKIDMPF